MAGQEAFRDGSAKPARSSICLPGHAHIAAAKNPAKAGSWRRRANFHKGYKPGLF